MPWSTWLLLGGAAADMRDAGSVDPASAGGVRFWSAWMVRHGLCRRCSSVGDRGVVQDPGEIAVDLGVSAEGGAWQ